MKELLYAVFGSVYGLGLFGGVLSALLWWGLPAARRLVRNSLLALTFFLAGQYLVAPLVAAGFLRPAAALQEICTIAIGVALVRLAGLAIFRLALGHLAIPRILEDITVVLAAVAWGMVVLRGAGVDLSGMIATSALVTAILAFSMQETLGNVLGGLALEWDSSLSIGDWIRLEGGDGAVSGQVTDMRWRYTAVRTRNGETVIIPNAQLMKTRFTVVGTPGGETRSSRRWVWFNVDTRTLPGRVAELVERVVREADIPHVAPDPAPECVLMDFGPGYLRYALRYWLTDPRVDDPTDSAVRGHIVAALQRTGYGLALPEERRSMVKEGATHAEGVARQEVARRMGALRGLEIFAELTDAELQDMAARLAYAPFAAGDIVYREGAVAHWLYILAEGEVALWYEKVGGERRLLTVLPAGSVFGEMGLMTGEPRRATVTARTDAECYRLDKAGFEGIIHARPGIAESMSRILATRSQQLQHMREELAVEADANANASHSADILERIRSFFGLEDRG